MKGISAEAFCAVPALPTSSEKPYIRQVSCPRMGPWKKGEKDAAYQQQQEILARRRSRAKSKEYFDSVRKRRDQIESRISERTLKVNVAEGEDPLVPWMKMKEKGLIDEAGYGEEESGGIVVPMASFGIPKYDNGGRFDLKLPHVEIGYTDEDADVMGKASRAIKGFFGIGGKNNTDAKGEDR